jgi:hypothetical protein
MWTPEVSQLVPDNDASNFLIASWHELFDALTPDTFQPRVHNIPSLVSELENLSSRLCGELGDTRWKQHIQLVKEECRELVTESQHLLQQLPEYKWHLHRLLSDDDPRQIQLNATILQQHQLLFENQLFEQLKSTVATMPKTKEACHKALRSVATLALQQGKEDDDLLEDESFETNLPASEIATRMRMIVERNDRDFDCVFVVIGKSVPFLSKLGFKSFKRGLLPQEEIKHFNTIYGHDGFHCLAVTAKARSYRNAQSNAATRLATALNVFNLHANAKELWICPKSFVRVSKALKFRIFNQEEPAYRRLNRRNRVIKDTEESLDLFFRKQVDERILNALELHATALGSSEYRVRLVNLWSALECLSASCKGSSVIERVCELVTPILVWRRPDKLVRYLAIETQRFAEHLGNHNYGVGFPRSKPDFVHPWDLMLTLAKPKGNSGLKEYFDLIGAHPYLRFRAKRLWELLSDPNELFKSQDASSKRVRWQLYRIYRARNILVHQGEEAPQFNALLDSLMYYTSVVISRVLHGLKINKSWRVREAWEYWRLKSEYVSDSLKNQASVLTVGDFFPRTYDKGHSEPLWPMK